MPVEWKQLSPGVAVITVTGRLVAGKETDRLETMVKDLVAAGQQKMFICEITDLDYADSSGIATFISCLTTIRKSGAEMRLAGANPRIQRLFTLAGVNHLMAVFPNVAAATAG